LVYGNQVYEEYQEGQELKAYIKFVRDDGKIDVSFQPKKKQAGFFYYWQNYR